MYDSWSKLQSGIFSRNVQDLGNYDQCIEFNHVTDSSIVENIQGKYCATIFHATQNKSIISDNNENFDLIEM